MDPKTDENTVRLKGYDKLFFRSAATPQWDGANVVTTLFGAECSNTNTDCNTAHQNHLFNINQLASDFSMKAAEEQINRVDW